MTTLAIGVAVIMACATTWIAVLYQKIHSKVEWLRNVLIPWLNELSDKLDVPKPPGLPPYQP